MQGSCEFTDQLEFTAKLKGGSKFCLNSSSKVEVRVKTWIFHFVQMGQLSIYMDNFLTGQILQKVPRNAELCLATGYFNLTQDYMDSLLEASQPNIHILMAHPLVNCFCCIILTPNLPFYFC